VSGCVWCAYLGNRGQRELVVCDIKRVPQPFDVGQLQPSAHLRARMHRLTQAGVRLPGLSAHQVDSRFRYP